MKTYKLVYNPYTVETKLYAVKGTDQLTPIGEGSSLSPIFHQRMQKWLAPHDEWRGFFAELKDACGEDHIELRFVGTEEDYRDLLAASRQYTPGLDLAVDVRAVLPKDVQTQVGGTFKLMQVRKLLQDAAENAKSSTKSSAKKNGEEVVLPKDILTSLQNALDPSFEINVVAPVSAGKSTLQNALIGRKLLPTDNLAKTAVLTRIHIDNGMSEFRAESLLHSEERQVHDGPVTQALITRLNDELDPADEKGENALRDVIFLEGPSEQFLDCRLDLVFVDTPGGNNAMNERHGEVMRRALLAENKNMILFVFNQNTISHDSTIAALQEAAAAMSRGLNGKMSNDRFLFVCTGCDMIPDNLDNTEEHIRHVLNACGITQPNLFMVSALTVELLRTEEFNRRMTAAGKPDHCEELSKTEKNMLEACIKNLALPECDLYAHAAIPDDRKKALGEQIGKLREAYKEREMFLEAVEEGDKECSPQDERRIRGEFRQLGRQLALLNSGIPGLEIAIREYLDRYAIPMKIQQAVESIRAKAEEAEMQKKVSQLWATSADAAAAAKREAEAKKAEMERSQVLKNDRDRLENLELDKNAINNKSAKCIQRLDDLVMPATSEAKEMTIREKHGMWITEKSAKAYLATVNAYLQNYMEPIVAEMTDYFNKTVVDTCNEIMEDYRKHISELKDSGKFNLAGLDVEKIVAATPEISSSINLNRIAESHREAVGSKLVAKKGAWNFVKRLFGASSAYENVVVYGDVKYVFVQDLITTQRGKMIAAFHDLVKSETGKLEKSIKALRKDVAKRMNTLDKFIKELYRAYIEKLGNSKQLQADAQRWKEQSQWLDDFLGRIDRLLDVESADFSGSGAKKG